MAGTGRDLSVQMFSVTDVQRCTTVKECDATEA